MAIQMTGIASGLDTDSIVKAMLATDEAKITSVQNKKTELEWKKDKWKEVNDRINKFQSDYVDKLRFESTFEKYSIKSSNSNISVKSAGSLPEGTHKIQILSQPTGPQAIGNGMSAFDSLEEGKSISKNTSFKDYNMLSDSVTFQVNGKDVTIDPEDTLSSLERKIREADSSLNVNFDTKNKKLFISSKETGKDTKIEISGVGNNAFLNGLGLSDVSSKGSAGLIKYNGIEVEVNDYPIEINGLKLEITGKVDPNEEITITVGNDTDAVVNFMEEFVNEYNSIMDELNSLYSAKKITTGPLSESDKAAMTDKQVDEYEKMVKDSLLSGDKELKAVIDTLRSSVQGTFANAGSKYNSLSSIGITTGNYSEKGKLHLDKDKLKAALNDDANAVKDLFTSKTGIGSKLNNSMNNLSKRVEGMKSYKSFYNDKLTDKEVKSLNEKTQTLQKKYTARQTKLYRKFALMEKQMSMLNTQSSSLMGMFGMY